MAQDTKKLFQITEAAHACGISRSTLLRMEERGLLTPAYIAPDSGRRYYDNHNVARILQVEKFRTMGLSSNEIADYYAKGGEASGQLVSLERRLHDLQRSVEELRLLTQEAPSFSVQIMTLPAVTCRMWLCEGHTVAEKYASMYEFYGACVRNGCVLSDEPLFTISERLDYLDDHLSDAPYPFWCCVPVRPDRTHTDVATLPACRALSVLYCGDYGGRSLAAPGTRDKSARAEACGTSARARYRRTQHRAGDRSAPLLLPLCRSRRTVTIPSAQKTARKFRKEWAVLLLHGCFDVCILLKNQEFICIRGDKS